MLGLGIKRHLPLIGIVLLTVTFLGGAVSPASAREPQEVRSLQLAATAAEEADEDDVNDPLEPLNRFIFDFNDVFIRMLLRPFSEFYQAFVPPPVREAVSNFLDNISTPVVLANDILQGEGQRAQETIERFVVNSTLGVGGLYDFADNVLDIPGHDEDFGQTLAVWGVGEGFYFVVPFYGPSSPRDAVGKLLVDGYLDPVSLWANNTDRDTLIYSRMALNAVDEYGSVMDELDQIKKTSIDYYAAIRSMYRQKRAAEIKNGEEIDLPPIPDLSLDVLKQDDDQAAVTGDESSEEAEIPIVLAF